jgi:hypothetical protein
MMQYVTDNYECDERILHLNKETDDEKYKYIQECIDKITGSSKNKKISDTLIITVIDYYDIREYKVIKIYEELTKKYEGKHFIPMIRREYLDRIDDYYLSHDIFEINKSLIKYYENFDVRVIESKHQTYDFDKYFLKLFNNYNNIIVYNVKRFIGENETYFHKEIKLSDIGIHYKISVLK